MKILKLLRHHHLFLKLFLVTNVFSQQYQGFLVKVAEMMTSAPTIECETGWNLLTKT